MSNRALITGITGQDGYFLAELLVERGYEVHGATRSVEPANVARLGRIAQSIQLHAYDPGDESSLSELIRTVSPNEVYNLAGPSFVPDCVSNPLWAAELLAIAPLRMLEAIRTFNSEIRFFQAGSSELFGDAVMAPQCETTPLRPANTYGAAKAFAFWAVNDYRQRHGLFACNGILFNHESPRRDERFVTRKITLAVARIALEKQDKLVLGNLDARRDWGYAGDYVSAMHQMLQHEKPDDYVIATGRQHSVREFAELAFSIAGLDWREYVELDESLSRRGDAHGLVGDAAKARAVLGWKPATPFEELVHQMVSADLMREGAQDGSMERLARFSTGQKGTKVDL